MYSKSDEKIICVGNGYGECNEKAVYMRCTQFAGDHPLCEKHAKEDKKFMVEDSYQFWCEIDQNE